MTEPKVFISYSRDDADWVRRFAEALREQSVSVWLDEWQISVGESLREAIESGLRSNDAIVVVLSEASAQRPAIFFELGVALGMGKRLIPVVPQSLETSALPFDIRLLRRYVTKGPPDVVAREVAEGLKGKAA